MPHTNMIVAIPPKEKNITHQTSVEVTVPEEDITGYNYLDSDEYQSYIVNEYSLVNESKIKSTRGTLVTNLSFNSNYATIKNKFELEFAKYSDYILADKNQACNVFYEVAKNISNINFKKIAIELTPSNAVKFTLILNEKFVLTITKPFEKIDGLEKDCVVFNLFNNRELIVSNTSKIDELVKGINSYLQM